MSVLKATDYKIKIILILMIICVQYWNDTEISWDPAEFEMIDSLRVSPDKVWMPEVVLINK